MNIDTVVTKENNSIKKFITDSAKAGLITGRVLDYGCGRQPYRPIVEKEIKAGRALTYEGFDRVGYPHSMASKDVGGQPPRFSYDTVICTQVIQYVPPTVLVNWLQALRLFLVHPGGHLLLTGPTNWPDINDLHRLTIGCAHRLLVDAGFENVQIDYRKPEFVKGLPYGYWAVASV